MNWKRDQGKSEHSKFEIFFEMNQMEEVENQAPSDFLVPLATMSFRKFQKWKCYLCPGSCQNNDLLPIIAEGQNVYFPSWDHGRWLFTVNICAKLPRVLFPV